MAHRKHKSYLSLSTLLTKSDALLFGLVLIVWRIWRKPTPQVVPELHCAVNGRFTYWGGKRPVPGGISYENFELREPFRSGQTFIFVITRHSL